MRNIFKSFSAWSFGAGAAVGAFATWRFVVKKFERIAQEEIDSVKEEFRKKEKELAKSKETTEAEDKPAKADADLLAFRRKGPRVDYTSFSKDPPEEAIVEAGTPIMPPEAKPYILAPEDFGGDDYEPITLTHYADGILVDEDDEPIENVDEMVGLDYASHFGEYDNDVVYVRNERLKCDYEILRDERDYGVILE